LGYFFKCVRPECVSGNIGLITFLVKFQDGFDLFTFVTFLLQDTQSNQKTLPLRHGAQVCRYWPKIKTFPHAGKLLLSKAKQAYLKAGKPSLAATFFLGSISSNKPAFLPTAF
ncbi:hypothetical protein, partial [Echinicola rosea]|uniref:hypothetical protein n=1 Tax=Echinicola rosea TaxID=1807691 RepID=UPI0016662082